MKYLRNPICSKFLEEYKSQNYEVLTCAMQNYRGNMEDYYCVQLNLKSHPEYSLFGIFDGHGGESAAKFLRDYLVDKLDKLSNIENSKLVQDAFLQFDQEYSQITKDKNCGSTVLFALIKPLENDEYQVRVFWCGDSRAIWIDRKNLANEDAVYFNQVTKDHKPSLKSETLRIANANGFVISDRVNGDLAVSRAFGDYKYKENKNLAWDKQSVIAVCDSNELKIKANDYITLFSDGLYEAWDNEEVCRHLYHYINQYESGKIKSKEVLRNLLDDIFLQSENSDNMSIILIKFLPFRESQEKNHNAYHDAVFVPGPLYFYQKDSNFMKEYINNANSYGFDTKNNLNELYRLGYLEDINWINKYHNNEKGKEKIFEIQEGIEKIKDNKNLIQ